MFNDVQKNKDQITAILVGTQIIGKKIHSSSLPVQTVVVTFFVTHHEQTSDPLFNQADARISVADIGMLL